MSDHATPSEENGVPQNDLLEQVLSESNLNAAWKRVRANKGVPGIDGMSVAEGKVFVSMIDGSVVCFRERQHGVK